MGKGQGLLVDFFDARQTPLTVADTLQRRAELIRLGVRHGSTISRNAICRPVACRRRSNSCAALARRPFPEGERIGEFPACRLR